MSTNKTCPILNLGSGEEFADIRASAINTKKRELRPEIFRSALVRVLQRSESMFLGSTEPALSEAERAASL
jgi:hypothetical protein